MSDALLRIEGLRKVFRGRHGDVTAVDGADLAVAAGTTVALVGESGSGKTTLGRCVLGLTDFDGGSIEVDGQRVADLRGKALREFRRTAQMVFQANSASLNPRMKVRAILEEPQLLAGERSTARRRARALEALDEVDLDRSYAERYPGELSGGEQQRVGIARAMIAHPRLVVLDEPTAALDASVRKGIYELLAGLQRAHGLSYLLISHDLTSVWGVSDRVAVMHRGRIVEFGTREELFLDPRHPYSVALISAAPHIGERPQARPARLVLAGEEDLGAADVCRFAGRCPVAVDACTASRPPLEAVGADAPRDGAAPATHAAACFREEEVPALLGEYRGGWRNVADDAA